LNIPILGEEVISSNDIEHVLSKPEKSVPEFSPPVRFRGVYKHPDSKIPPTQHDDYYSSINNLMSLEPRPFERRFPSTTPTSVSDQIVENVGENMEKDNSMSASQQFNKIVANTGTYLKIKRERRKTMFYRNIAITSRGKQYSYNRYTILSTLLKIAA